MWIFGRKSPSGFSASSTAEEVTQGIDGTGLTAIVTGASSGIGTETTRVLALRGVHVVMAVRNTNAGGKVREAILKENPSATIDVMELDLSSMASVRKFASEYTSSGLPLNILIYRMWSAYGQSKLANILHANELAKRLKKVEAGLPGSWNGIGNGNGIAEQGVEITSNTLHPGIIATNFLHQRLVKTIAEYMGKNLQQGTATTCYVALHPQVKGVSGEFFSDCNLAKRSALAKDEELAKKLWDFSLSLTNTK
ncbi:hypothetical protein RHMOL_Rhmol02G0290700 [Rhododendron molle]|uniref:Uncharacterized protein n=1 Tax=Rhododendron molle TaxID=49168 RepID=A0ACC0PVU4_RHOML|nr:hypothetical protein RHMOL_Rhmol02G0290700 [Rhododendron molle]